MTDLRTAAQQALEALEFMEAYLATEQQAKNKAITALRAALAEPVQQGCDHCNQPLYAAVKCRVCGRVAQAEPVQEPVWVCPDSAEHRYQKPGHCEDCGKTLVQERNFCPRCGKRTQGIHTCTPP